MLHTAQSVSAWPLWGGDASSLVGLATTAAVYGIGVRRVWRQAGRGRGVSRIQVGAFVSGIGVLALALLSPIDALSDDLFSVHMAQHVLLAVVVPPFLVAGAPGVAFAWALPRTWRSALPALLIRTRWIASFWRTLTQPFVAAAVFAISLWSWHLPRLYIAALDDAFVHFLEHASFIATASLIWWSILHPRQSRRSGYATGILTLFLTTLQSGALGALLTLSERVWYPVQARAAGVFGLAPLEDQQLAGLIMWVPGGLLYLVAMAVLFVAWMRQFPGRRSAIADIAAAATTAVYIAR